MLHHVLIMVLLKITHLTASCNGGVDGSVLLLLLIQMVQTFTHGLMLVLLFQPATSASGLSSGTYTCTVSDTVNGCSINSAAVTIGGPTAFSSASCCGSTSPINTDSAVSLSVSGGSPCFNGLR